MCHSFAALTKICLIRKQALSLCDQNRGYKTWVLTNVKKYKLFCTFCIYFVWISLFFRGPPVHTSEQKLKYTEIEPIPSKSYGPQSSYLHKWEQHLLVPSKMKGWGKTGSNPHRKCVTNLERQSSQPSLQQAFREGEAQIGIFYPENGLSEQD